MQVKRWMNEKRFLIISDFPPLPRFYPPLPNFSFFKIRNTPDGCYTDITDPAVWSWRMPLKESHILYKYGCCVHPFYAAPDLFSQVTVIEYRRCTDFRSVSAPNSLSVRSDVHWNIARYVLRSTKRDLLHKTLAMCMEPAITPKS